MPGPDIRIAPSLICADFLEIGKQIRKLNNLADVYHCDVIDNHFAPAFGLPIEFLLKVKEIATLPIDVHLMVNNVEEVVERVIPLELDMITIHIEGVASTAFRVIEKIKEAGMKVGIAINPVSPLENLRYVMAIADKVTIMTFDPGIPGQELVDGTLGKVFDLATIKSEKSYSFDIEVDGSCNERNFKKMKTAGANQFVIGTSGLFSLDEDIESAWQKMKMYIG
jgi:D-allulose-6-phosphate 3-epimerase